MKISFYLSIILIFISSTALGARVDATGEIGEIRYHINEGTLAPAWNKTIWFQLINSDKTFCTSNKVSIKDGDDMAVSMLLAAKMANKKVLITLEDTIKYPAGTYCLLQYITIK
ncbi:MULTISPECIES: hypothetical protein [unclassified Colwellia]|uniref:hypothetical protein n=1 Tax=unclassified Colwellia TaxID=196834 RepID=UPI0015F60413|nr:MULTISPECIES: hypothetical protein [unclassified Colwellia]MBA6233515.1 hypothetical protein [Colwellia sp. MB02u-7]MBA6238075.1 hypothetical protein [Colwellia sp. MB02u-11]MBA6257304.1 hypothetical protein [Colwellia sp. MB3u-28]MBA6258888.1 hypothetical protein [Colwellia sp. MB3u-41]MBA6299788.1 hypothetical protein [Colwellia sp. MB3u-22]